MNNGISKLLIVALFLFTSQSAFAQSSAGSSPNYLLYVLAAIAVLMIFAVISLVTNTFVSMEAEKLGVELEEDDTSILPSFSNIGKGKLPGYVESNKLTYLSKGHDILLEGEAANHVDNNVSVSTFAVQPPNFIGMSPIPKVTVEVGEEVKAGDVLFFDKKRPDIKYVAPVSGEVIAVNRAAKRAISEVVILADKDQKYHTFPLLDLHESSRAELVEFLLDTGAWPHINQRPFDVVPDPTDIPKSIFISTFDSAPLAPDLNLAVQGKEEAFQTGLDVLNKLTPGKVYLGISTSGNPSPAFTEAINVEKHYFHGAHPAGNVGVHIHHIDPIITADDKVWTLSVHDVLTIGSIFTEGRYNAERIVALTGAEVGEPRYVKTYLGANIGDLLKNNLTNDHVRVVSGDVLSGKVKNNEGFLNFRDDQITVLEEGDQYEMFGWLLPLSPRPSISNTFPNFLFPDMKFKANTNTHGEKRAFVVTGQYESVMPMDIYPQHLMKSIIVNDIERMEGLGIYELTEEDIALCEFVCTSKQPLQKILREGLEVMREQ